MGYDDFANYPGLTARPATVNGDEVDAIEHAHVFGYRAGERKKVKRGMNRRGRREARRLLAMAY